LLGREVCLLDGAPDHGRSHARRPDPAPPFPSYTSGHSTISAAAATVLGHLFPADAAGLATMAREAKDSRLWAGIHFPIDNETAATGGRRIGQLVLTAGGMALVPAGA